MSDEPVAPPPDFDPGDDPNVIEPFPDPDVIEPFPGGTPPPPPGEPGRESAQTRLR